MRSPTEILAALRAARSTTDITLNTKQREFYDAVLSGKSCVLIGAAGTGKTTCLKAALEAVAQLPTETPLRDAHKYLQVGASSSVCTSFTRRAVSNLARAVGSAFASNCITIHKLLEYQPTYEEVQDEETMEYKTVMRFKPMRTRYNPLDSAIQRIIMDEASMVSLELHEEIVICTPGNVQRIYIGDINQLPPVFGSAVLGYKMLELPVIELTEIYRQAANSPIISYATRIKEGHTFKLTDKLVEETEDGKITFHPWKKSLHAEDACNTAAAFLKVAYDAGAYDPEEHAVLCPFNKAFGTIELNKHVANHLARKHARTTYEVIAGFNYHYFSVGDKVMYDKQDAHITAIAINAAYSGSKRPKPASLTLDYWGGEQGTPPITQQNDLSVDEILDKLATVEDEDRVNAASHIITITLDDTGQEVVIDKAASINNLALGYILTVHKAQGAEWEKVFVLLHQSHATMLQRELLYTAITRARKECYVICEKDTFVKGVLSQKIKGNTLEEKAQHFMGRINERSM